LIVTIFRSCLRKEYIKEYSEVAERMERLAKEMPGSDGIPFKTYGNDKWLQILFGSHSREGGNP